jgi:hypothetical protein
LSPFPQGKFFSPHAFSLKKLPKSICFFDFIHGKNNFFENRIKLYTLWLKEEILTTKSLKYYVMKIIKVLIIV